MELGDTVQRCLGGHIPNARHQGSGYTELHCTSRKIQQGGGNAGAHVDLLEQHHTEMLCESAGNRRAIDGSGQEFGKKKCLQFFATALRTTEDSVRQEKKHRNICNQPSRSRETLTGATETRFNPMKSTCATPTKQMEKEMQQNAEQSG